MPLDGESASPQELLNLAVEVYDLLQRKDATMGELLQIMEAKHGQEKSIEQTSDKVVSMQAEVDEKFRRMIRGIRRVGDGLVATESGGQGGAAGSSSREAEELKASIISVTQREKDRVEGLQAQLEMIRFELKECRKQRGSDQTHIAAIVSQSSQLKAALTCAEDDLEALRSTLDKELGRCHVLQGRVSQLEGELRSSRKAAKESEKEKDLEVARLRELVDSLGQEKQLQEDRPTPHWGAGGGASHEEEEEDVRQSSERALYEAYVETRRGQMSESWEDGGRDDEVGEGREELDHREAHTHRIPTGSNENGSSFGEAPVKNSPSGASHQQPLPRPMVRPASAKASSGEALRRKQASPEQPPPSFMAAPRGRAKREVTDSLEYLASRVRSGHITKQTPLQLALEFCGKSSFSLRHNEEKYNVLSQQLVTLAYKHLRDRWVTVLKNAEPVDDKGTTKQPRLGSFEVELLWIDQDGSPRRTVLHSKLKTRVFPNVNRVIEELTDALNTVQLIADGDE